MATSHSGVRPAGGTVNQLQVNDGAGGFGAVPLEALSSGHGGKLHVPYGGHYVDEVLDPSATNIWELDFDGSPVVGMGSTGLIKTDAGMQSFDGNRRVEIKNHAAQIYCLDPGYAAAIFYAYSGSFPQSYVYMRADGAHSYKFEVYGNAAVPFYFAVDRVAKAGFKSNGGLCIGNSGAAPAGAVIGGIELFNAAGASIGFVELKAFT